MPTAPWPIPPWASTPRSIPNGCRISSGTSSASTARPGRYLKVEPRRYRFRLLNVCNSRLLDLSLDSRQPIFQIGSDGGLLPRAVALDHLLLAPAERADFILDFTELGGATITLRNQAKTPFVDGEPPDPQTTGQVLQFRVGRERRSPDHSLPAQALPLPAVR